MSDIFSKVLYVGPLNPYGGIGAVSRTYEENIKQFNFIATHKDQSKLGSIFHFFYSVNKIIFYLLFNRKIKIVHLHSASKGSFIRKVIIVLIAKTFKKRVVFHMHGGQFKEYFKQLSWGKNFLKEVLKRVDIFICLTEEWKFYFEQNLGLNNVSILGNPIKIQDSVTVKPLNHVISLLFLGSINSKKGIFDLLIFLESNIYFKNKQIQLTIGGTGEVEKLTSLIQDPIFLNQINYIGFVTGKLKDDAIKDCDVFILPSYYDGLPVSILEAMGHGKPVISTRVGGVPSIVKENNNGWLFNAGDFKQLDKIFDDIIHKKFPLKLYQQNAYNTASEFSSEKVLLNLSNIYKNMLNE